MQPPPRALYGRVASQWLSQRSVKLYSRIYDRGVTFHFLHKTDGQPLKYVKMCTKDNAIVPWNEVVRGYEVAKDEYVVF